MAVRLHVNGKELTAPIGDWTEGILEGPKEISSPHGRLSAVTLRGSLAETGLAYTLTFAVALETPFFLWKLALTNRGRDGLAVDRLEMMRAGADGLIETGSRVSLSDQPDGSPAFYLNGWQSWAYSGVYAQADMERQSRIRWLTGMLTVNPGTPHVNLPGHFGSDFFGILGDRQSRAAVLTGFLSQKQQFGSLEARTAPDLSLNLWANGDGARLDPGRTMETDWAALTFFGLDDPDPQAAYLDAVAREYGVDASHPPEIPVGWCSWYEFYQNVTAQQISQNLDVISLQKNQLPLSLVQIDDGFERQPGDWFSFRPGFPQGVAPLAREIRTAGFVPGLWLAPFIVHPQAQLIKEHPEYLLRGRFNLPVNAGFLWNTLTTALDLTHPGALEYACKVVDTAAHEWGFPYLKLDFLYAGGLAGRHFDPTLTRAQILRQGLEAIRQAAGEETFLLGCGAPLGSAVGLFQAMRIGEDVSGDWLPTFPRFEKYVREEPDMPSEARALQNILTRAPMHRRWWVNDPDCLLVRETTHLSLGEVQSLATAIAMTGGSLLLSDDLPALSPERLRIAEALLPVIGLRPQMPDWFDGHTPSRLRIDLQGPAGPWYMLALFNWADEAHNLYLRLKDYGFDQYEPFTGHSFWSQETIMQDREGFEARGIAPHGVALLAVRPLTITQPQYLGSDLHISQGLEMAAWKVDNGLIQLELCLPRSASGHVDLELQRAPTAALLDGRPVAWEPIQGLARSCYRFAVAFEHAAQMEVRY
jgi:alpha-galactosidase